jgi:predicted transcriptional regulator
MDSNLVKLFGKTVQIQIIDAFIDGMGEDFSKKEIQELTGLSKATILNNWKAVEETGVIKIKRQFGNVKLFTLDTKNALTKGILELEKKMLKIEEEKIPA